MYTRISDLSFLLHTESGQSVETVHATVIVTLHVQACQWTESNADDPGVAIPSFIT